MSLYYVCCTHWSKQGKSSRKGKKQKHLLERARSRRDQGRPEGPLSWLKDSILPHRYIPHPSPVTLRTLKPPTFASEQAFEKMSRHPRHPLPTPVPHPTPPYRAALFRAPDIDVKLPLERASLHLWFLVKGSCFSSPAEPWTAEISNTRLRRKRQCLAPPWLNAFAHPSLQNKSCSFPCAKIPL